MGSDWPSAFAVAVAFFAVLTAYVYLTLPLEEGDRIVALENRNVMRNNEDRRVLHDFVTWRDELSTIQGLGAFRTVSRNPIPLGRVVDREALARRAREQTQPRTEPPR